MLTPVCIALALAAAPRIAVVVVDGPGAARAELLDALGADPTVSAQSASLVDKLLSGAAAAGLVCTVEDVSCWTKVGLDGELDLLVIAGTAASGAFELRLVDVGTGSETGRVTVDAGQQLDARAALARLLHHPPPEPAPPPAPPPAERAAEGQPPPAPAARPPHPDPAPSGPTTSSMLLIAAGGAAVVGAACGIAAASVDVNLTETLVAARDAGTPIDLPSYRDQEQAQNFMIACGAVAGAAAIAGAAGALLFE